MALAFYLVASLLMLCVYGFQDTSAPTELMESPTSSEGISMHEGGHSYNPRRDMTKRSVEGLHSPTHYCHLFSRHLELSIEVMEDFKEKYATSLGFKTWNEANRAPWGSTLNPIYLPEIPEVLFPYSTADFDSELKRIYAMMQRCLVSLEVMVLDQVSANKHNFRKETTEVIALVELSLDYLKVLMESRDCRPDDEETRTVAHAIYEEVRIEDKKVRGFVIWREVRRAFINARNTLDNAQRQQLGSC